MKVFSATGTEVGTKIVANTTLTYAQSHPSIAALDNGGFVVSWTNAGQAGPDNSGDSIHAQVFKPFTGETLVGTEGNDTLVGKSGNDALEGLAGNDILDGRGGIDTAVYEHAASAVRISLGRLSAQDTGDGKDTLIGIENLSGSAFGDTLIGNDRNNQLDGRAGADRLDGGAGNDHLIGGGGNDILIGNTGADLMEGGAGNDTYYVDNIHDRVFEEANYSAAAGGDIGGNDTVRASVTYTLTDRVETLVLQGTANIRGTGNALDNKIVGNAGNNIIDGGAGADRLVGGAGSDAFVFSAQPDGTLDVIADFAPGSDTIRLSHLAYAELASYGIGRLHDGELVIGKQATAPDQHLIYNAATGALFYDADGSGAQAQVKIAVLLGHPDLHASDVIVI